MALSASKTLRKSNDLHDGLHSIEDLLHSPAHNNVKLQDSLSGLFITGYDTDGALSENYHDAHDHLNDSIDIVI